jgi:hypothetical protein
VEVSGLNDKTRQHIKKKITEIEMESYKQYSDVTLVDKCDISLHSANYTDLMVQ